MATRPAKRQRRATLILSDDSEPDSKSRSSRRTKTSLQREITRDGKTSATVSPVKTTKSRSVSNKGGATSSPISSPEKTRKNSRVKAAPVKSKSLHAFFGKASEEQRWQRKSNTPEVEVENNAELSDAIEDDDLSDETLQELGVKTGISSTSLDRPKSRILPSSGSLPSSQRFVKPTIPTRKVANEVNGAHPEVEGHCPWADRYGPTSLDELMVHKKKITDVQSWLQGKVDGKNSQKLLILKGPAGSGKTTTVSLLSKAMGLQMVAWHNPTISDSSPTNSISAQFDDFLNRGGQFGSLAFNQDTHPERSTTSASKQLLVIEEFPATMTRSSNALQSFRSVILRSLARAKSAPAMNFHQGTNNSSPPVIMIISETLLSSSTALSDSFTAHRLLGPEILNHPFVTAMDFNPVATTLMTKALDLVVKKEARDSRRRRTPGPGVIAKLAEIGDIRSAVNSLEFLCLRGGDGSEWSGTVAAKVKRGSKDIPSLTEIERNSLALVSQRESTLDMFHASGKIVYNKREDPRVLDTRAEPPPKPPDHLLHLYSPKMSQVDIEALLNETGTDIQTFISTLHENYILSCTGDSFESSFDGCSEILSISDVLDPESRPNRRGNNANPNAGIVHSNFQAAASDSLRQDEIGFNVATRGLLFNLPFPVNRAAGALPGGKSGDVYKMFYPASLRLWKPIEETQGLLEMFIHGSGAPALRTMAAGLDGTRADEGVASWQSRSLGAGIPVSTTPPIKLEPSDGGVNYPQLPEYEDEDSSPSPPTTRSKEVLTLELLPYMNRIFTAKKKDTSLFDKITKFKPTSYLSTGQEGLEEDEDDVVPSNGTPVRASAGFRRPVMAGVGAAAAKQNALKMEESSAAVQNLYIEDDDIEDD